MEIVVVVVVFNQEVALTYASPLSVSCPHAPTVSDCMRDLWSATAEVNRYVQGTK